MPNFAKAPVYDIEHGYLLVKPQPDLYKSIFFPKNATGNATKTSDLLPLFEDLYENITGSDYNFKIDLESNPYPAQNTDRVLHDAAIWVGQDWCKRNSVRLIHNSQLCVRNGYYGYAVWGFGPKRIEISPPKPNRIKFRYQYKLPQYTQLAGTLFHEIFHHKFKHNKVMLKEQREFEAEVGSYLVSSLFGVEHARWTRSYIQGYVLKNGIKYWGNKCRDRILEMAQILVSDFKLMGDTKSYGAV